MPSKAVVNEMYLNITQKICEKAFMLLSYTFNIYNFMKLVILLDLKIYKKKKVLKELKIC